MPNKKTSGTDKKIAEVSIVQKDDAILRAKAKEVTLGDIGSAKIDSIIADMSKAMASQNDGIAIAAPQIGQSLRIFLVSGSLLAKADPTYKGPQTDLIFINPKITKIGRAHV